jgi:VanZ like family
MHEVGLGLAQRWRALADRFGNRLVGANALLLMVASWTPGSVMVRSGIFSGHVEHAAAYALSGALIYALRAGRSTAWAAALLLSAYAGALELGQIFVPGRHAGFDDFVFSVTGAITGILVSAALLKQAQVGGK